MSNSVHDGEDKTASLKTKQRAEAILGGIRPELERGGWGADDWIDNTLEGVLGKLMQRVKDGEVSIAPLGTSTTHITESSRTTSDRPGTRTIATAFRHAPREKRLFESVLRSRKGGSWRLRASFPRERYPPPKKKPDSQEKHLT